MKKQGGQDYEPNSLCSMQTSIDRYLRERGYTHSIIKLREFAFSKSVLEEKHQLFAKMEMEGDQIKVVA